MLDFTGEREGGRKGGKRKDGWKASEQTERQRFFFGRKGEEGMGTKARWMESGAGMRDGKRTGRGMHAPSFETTG